MLRTAQYVTAIVILALAALVAWEMAMHESAEYGYVGPMLVGAVKTWLAFCSALLPIAVVIAVVRRVFPARDDGVPRCARCGYSLVGLMAETCPECGQSAREATGKKAALGPIRLMYLAASAGVLLGLISAISWVYPDYAAFKREAAAHFATGATTSYMRQRAWPCGYSSFVQMNPKGPVFSTG